MLDEIHYSETRSRRVNKSFIIAPHAERLYAECRYGECRYAECRGAEFLCLPYVQTCRFFIAPTLKGVKTTFLYLSPSLGRCHKTFFIVMGRSSTIIS